MPDTLLQGFTVPSQPNSGIAVFDTDYVPSQFVTNEAVALNASANGPMRLTAIQSTAADLRAIFSVPVGVAGVTPTNSSAKLAVGTPTVSNTPYEGTFIQGITRFLRRLSKLNRGTN